MTDEARIFCSMLFILGWLIAFRWGWVLGRCNLSEKHRLELTQVKCMRLKELLGESE